ETGASPSCGASSLLSTNWSMGTSGAASSSGPGASVDDGLEGEASIVDDSLVAAAASVAVSAPSSTSPIVQAVSDRARPRPAVAASSRRGRGSGVVRMSGSLSVHRHREARPAPYQVFGWYPLLMTSTTRREELLALAAGLFAEHGLRATTVRDIADAAGILSGSLYHHFSSKEAIVDEILRGFLDSLFGDYRRIVDAGMGPRATLEGLVRASFE